MKLEEFPNRMNKVATRLIHGKPRLDPRKAEGPVFATFQDRLFASAIDMGVILYIFNDVLIWIKDTLYKGVDQQAFAPLPSEIEHAPFATQFDFFVQRGMELHFFELWLLVGLIQSLIFGITLVAVWTYLDTTPGKFIIGLRFASRNGEGTPTFLQYLKRYAGFYVSMPILMIGFALLGFDRQKRAWHDRIAGTTVIYNKEGHIFRRGWDWLKRFVKERYGKKS